MPLSQYAIIVLVDIDFNTTSEIDSKARSLRPTTPKIVACGVQGVCGFVIDDFGDEFIVEDSDGEVQKEVCSENI